MAANTVEGRFTTADASESRMYFEQVRIPLFNENGRALDARSWANGLRRELRGRGAELLKHDFPLSGEELARRLGVRRGGGPRLAFTRIEGRFWTIRLK